MEEIFVVGKLQRSHVERRKRVQRKERRERINGNLKRQIK